jgi:hypothetical protein
MKVKPNAKTKKIMKKRHRLTAVTFLIFTHPPTPNKNYRSPLAYASR